MHEVVSFNATVDGTRGRETLPFTRNAASSRMVLNAVMHLNQPIFESLNGAQLQGHVAVAPRDQWNAIPDEHGDHTDDELVDRLLVEKGGDESASAHQPDVLAGLLSQTAYEGADRTTHELHT